MTTPTFALSTETHLEGTFDIVSVHGIEEVNRLYSFDVEFTADSTSAGLVDQLLKQQVTLTIAAGPSSIARSVHGVVAALREYGVVSQGRRAFRARIVPRMWLLKRRRTRRIFTDLSALDIAAQLFGEHQVKYRAQVVKELPKRPYCVQYDETDFTFLIRLFAEDGLFFVFEHSPVMGGDGETVLVADTGEAYLPIDGAPELRFARAIAGTGMELDEDHVTHFSPLASIRSSGVRVRGYDHRRPASDLRTEARAGVDGAVTTARNALLTKSDELAAVDSFDGSYEGTVPVPLPGVTAPTVPGEGPPAIWRSSRSRLSSSSFTCSFRCHGTSKHGRWSSNTMSTSSPGRWW